LLLLNFTLATMNKEDFPDTTTIKTRIKQFEDHFVSMFLVSFNSLPVRLRAATVSLAVRKPEPETATATDAGRAAAAAPPAAVSLYHYFRCPPAAAAAIEARRDYVITVPETVFRDAVAARRTGVVDVEDESKMASKMATGSTVARDAALAAAKMAADELSRVYEYQLALLAEEAAVKMVAGHAVDCVIDYVIAGRRTVVRLLDRNTIVQGKLIMLLAFYTKDTHSPPRIEGAGAYLRLIRQTLSSLSALEVVTTMRYANRRLFSFTTEPK